MLFTWLDQSIGLLILLVLAGSLGRLFAYAIVRWYERKRARSESLPCQMGA
jgi:membrane protein DedA with SNARE-associated domain